MSNLYNLIIENIHNYEKIKEILKDNLNDPEKFKEALKIIYEYNESLGYTKGYNSGYDICFEEGHDEGFRRGYANGCYRKEQGCSSKEQCSNFKSNK